MEMPKILSYKDIILNCEKSVALDSLDHLYPYGTIRDNSRNTRFNEKFYRLYQNEIQLRVLDLGCSGGGFVRDCINDGCFAIGLEGSDYSKKMRRAEWAIISEYLYTCDITKKFSILNKKGEIVKFHLITAWEVLEHIKEFDLDMLIKNIKKHLSDNGLVIVSISNTSDKHHNVELHQTQRSKDWWLKKFQTNGFYEMKSFYKYFNTQFIRGKYETPKNFHLILSLNPKKTPIRPKITLKEKFIDGFKGSKTYFNLHTLFD